MVGFCWRVVGHTSKIEAEDSSGIFLIGIHVHLQFDLLQSLEERERERKRHAERDIRCLILQESKMISILQEATDSSF